jgi:dTDP-4-dehydrorhamnose 3,5-epimerase
VTLSADHGDAVISSTEPVPARVLVGSPERLPYGLQIVPLLTHHDARGALTELSRDEWHVGTRFVQWNAVASRAGVLRGVHVHPRHADYLVVIAGEMILGLHDLRRDSPTERRSLLLRLSADDLLAVGIPPGVAHGFLFLCPAFHMYAIDHYWDPGDELACHWSSPELGLAWPIAEPVLSERDRTAGSYQAMRDAFDAAARSGEEACRR